MAIPIYTVLPYCVISHTPIYTRMYTGCHADNVYLSNCPSVQNFMWQVVICVIVFNWLVGVSGGMECG